MPRSEIAFLIHGASPTFAEGTARRKELHSNKAFKEDLRRHYRAALDPRDKFVEPAAASQDIGWHALQYSEGSRLGDVVLGYRTHHGKRCSDITKHHEGLIMGPRHA
eukprot:TRINITY_DN99400_c0_g1_i1.p1 TRINITY_DN99400_c0_g1~~TRINITY_DN99400_c0_g1_i1.p1  ORF type:complete len:115 (-),score=7.58 TRINITY_DN99400_c0_g1_i1:109-429(-)